MKKEIDRNKEEAKQQKKCKRLMLNKEGLFEYLNKIEGYSSLS